MASVIPVIDLLRGQVVRAVRGDRRNYQAIRSALCQGSEPLTVARALLAKCQSDTLYIADLDALQGGARQTAVLRELLQNLPETTVWLDAGFAEVTQAEELRAQLGALADRVLPVFASESLQSRDALAACCTGAAASRVALSLDRRDGQRLDVAGAWEAPELWPQRVIVMTLERVGSDAGPDLETIADVRRKAPGATIIGAGGIRHAADLAAGEAAGAQAWLVASALHDQRL